MPVDVYLAQGDLTVIVVVMLDGLRDLHRCHLRRVVQTAAETLFLHEESQLEQQELGDYLQFAIPHHLGQRFLARGDHMIELAVQLLLLARRDPTRASLFTLREDVVEVDQALPEVRLVWDLEAALRQVGDGFRDQLNCPGQ